MAGLFVKISRTVHFAGALRAYLREPVTAGQARAVIRRRLAERPEMLLSMAKSCIFDNAGSPYLKLLKAAGCEYGDLEHLVNANGVEGALERVAAHGVYVTIDEFKARKEIRRGSASFAVREADFNNPWRAGHLAAQSGASRSPGTRLYYDLDHLAEGWAVYYQLRGEAWGVAGYPGGIWMPISPGAGPVVLLAQAKIGAAPERWFSPVARSGFKPSRFSRAGTLVVVQAGRFWGANLPRPEYVALEDAVKVAAWMRDAIRRRGRCSLVTYVSAAVRVSQAATREGWRLKGATFFATGEPTTEAKKREITASGAAICPSYGYMEGGLVGMGCANPVSADDCHIFTDSFALVSTTTEIPRLGAPVRPFLFTSLLKSAPKILFNAENGDFGELGTRTCGCPLETEGFAAHVNNIRSYEKLTGEGMSFLGTDIIRIVEEVLPSRFGGYTTSYQFQEEEDSSGLTRMVLLVSPAVGPVDESLVVGTVMAELRKGGDGKRMMAEVWSNAGTLRVRRAEPVPTARGKLLPLRVVSRRSG